MFTVTATSAAAPDVVWREVTDFARHAEGVPLTSATSDVGGPGVGRRFTVRTALGPVGFDDPMVVTVWDPPFRVRVEKTGRVLSGWADICLTRTGSGTLVTWQEEVVPANRAVARLTRPLFDRVGRLVFGRALRRMLAAT